MKGQKNGLGGQSTGCWKSQWRLSLLVESQLLHFWLFCILSAYFLSVGCSRWRLYAYWRREWQIWFCWNLASMISAWGGTGWVEQVRGLRSCLLRTDADPQLL